MVLFFFRQVFDTINFSLFFHFFFFFISNVYFGTSRQNDRQISAKPNRRSANFDKWVKWLWIALHCCKILRAIVSTGFCLFLALNVIELNWMWNITISCFVSLKLFDRDAKIVRLIFINPSIKKKKKITTMTFLWNSWYIAVILAQLQA